jgi:MFS superfamily sulfate permease-like transporter
MKTDFKERISAGIGSLKTHWRDDLQAGFSVSLIALPLSLGIAIASGFPPMAGLIAAIVGGLFVSRINGSHVTITGPAAGLIVVNLAAVETLGQGNQTAGYYYTLAAIFIAGILITIFGFLKIGKFGDFFPLAAVHGMLAAIGVIIMVKQIFVALGYTPEGKELYEIALEIPHAISNANPDIAFIAGISLAILIAYPKIRNKYIRKIPAPMWVLIVTIPMAHYFDLFHEHHYHFAGRDFILGPKHLVQLPDKVMDGFHLPDFGKMWTGVFWVSVMTIALVTSIETLLSAAAVDTLDPQKRKTNMNSDLKALGSGSGISGLIGGLPVISEIVRSSANISNGAKTQWANFFHGLSLLMFLLLAKPLIEQIPLAALAAMLVFTGYRLASPNEFRHVYHIGKAQLVIFVVTLVMVLVTDLLIGIAAGIATKMIIHLYNGAPLKYMFKAKMDYEDEDEKSGIIHIQKAAIFSNFISLKKEIERHANKEHITLDFGGVDMIDHTFMDHIQEIKRSWEDSGKQMDLIHLNHLTSVSDHPLSARLNMNGNGNGKKKALTDHQKGLRDFGLSAGWEFRPEKQMADARWNGFSIFQGGKISYLENELISKFTSPERIYAELTIDYNVQTKSPDTKLSAVLIDCESPVPDFILEREGLLDKLRQATGQDDIDFPEHPRFSEKLSLIGKNEREIRKLFNAEIIEKIESEPDYHIECVSNRVILYRFDRHDDLESIKNLLTLSYDFQRAINALKLNARTTQHRSS